MEEEVCSDDKSRMFLELGFVFLKEDGSLCKIWIGGPRDYRTTSKPAGLYQGGHHVTVAPHLLHRAKMRLMATGSWVGGGRVQFTTGYYYPKEGGWYKN